MVTELVSRAKVRSTRCRYHPGRLQEACRHGSMAIAQNTIHDVMCAAQTLGVSERELLERAYLSSHHQTPSEEQVEAFYTPYKLRGTAPVWATRFARQVLSAQAPHQVSRKAHPRSVLVFSLELAIHLFVPPHAPDTLGPDRYRTFVA